MGNLFTSVGSLLLFSALISGGKSHLLASQPAGTLYWLLSIFLVDGISKKNMVRKNGKLTVV
jgi:hypothetical protein